MFEQPFEGEVFMHTITITQKRITAAGSGRMNREEAQALTVDVERLIEEPDNHGRELLIDMSRVEYLSSSGLGAIVRMFRATHTANMEMAVFCNKPEIRSLIELAGIDRLVKIINRIDTGKA